MINVSLIRGWSKITGRNRQRGQALIYGIFVLVGGLVALFFLFNTGQLAREKTKLVNTTDAVAYSAGVMNARALNFQAYTNRAMVANTVAIAQLVSLSSWVQYADNLGNFGVVANNPKFALFWPSYFGATTFGSTLQASLNNTTALSRLARTSDQIIRNVLMTSQQVVYAGLLPARLQVMNEVAQANYLNDGAIAVDAVPLTVNEYTSFVSRYSGDERTRFAEVARVAANRDPFVPRRSWRLPALWSDCPAATASGRVDWFDRRGGTELLGFDEWKAVDSLSEKRWVPKNKTDVFCQAIAETPAGWGSVAATDNGPSFNPDPRLHDFTLPINPGSTAIAFATSDTWGYSGLPNFYDLSDSARGEADPKLKFAIRVRRDKAQTQTSEARSAVRNSANLNAYQAQMAGGNEMAAVSASEVFFQRDGDIKDNEYGSGLAKPQEIGNLFNPFWQVRLIQSDADVRKAQILQGVVLP